MAKDEDDSREEEEGRDEDESGQSEGENDFIDRHHCTDPLCYLLFVASLLVFLVIFAWGLVAGDMRKLSHGIDVGGQLCGVSSAVADKPFLYYCARELTLADWNLTVDTRVAVCVPKCPTGVNVSAVSPATVPECPAQEQQAYLTRKVADWYCCPEEGAFAQAAAKVEESLESFHQRLASPDLCGIFNSWPVMLLVVVVATSMGYTYLFLLRALAKGLIWLCVGLSITALVVLGYHLWTQSPSSSWASAESSTQQGLARKAMAAVLWASAFLIACLACCCGREVELSTACIQTGTEVIWKMPLLLLAPLLKTLLKTGLAGLFFFGFVHLVSTAEVTGSGAQRRLSFTGTQWLLLLTFGFVGWWILAFVSAVYQFSIAYAVAKYYASPLDEDGGRDADGCGVLEGARAGLLYHTGSLAYGAALITVLELAQRALEYAEVRSQQEGNNECVACILKTVLTCCKCMEGVIQFISKNAYIDMAVTSSSFCQAVKNVTHTVVDHGAAMAVLNGATVIFQVAGVFAITALCGLLANVVLTSGTFSDSTSASRYVSSPSLATLAACFLGLMVSWAFMTVFDVTTDALLFCYVEDAGRHQGHAANAPEKMRKLYEDAEKKVAKRKHAAEMKAHEERSKFGAPSTRS